MKKLTLLAVVVLAVVLVAPASSARDKLTLHPAGFGSHSNAHWKAHQGLPDTGGNADQALYFQKMTSTATFAAGAAVVRGIEGLPAEQLTGLAWDHREDGHCGAGAPRWNVVVEPDGGGSPQVVFLGCNAAAHTEQAVYNGHAGVTTATTSPRSTPNSSSRRRVRLLTSQSGDLRSSSTRETTPRTRRPPDALRSQAQAVSYISTTSTSRSTGRGIAGLVRATTPRAARKRARSRRRSRRGSLRLGSQYRPGFRSIRWISAW